MSSGNNPFPTTPKGLDIRSLEEERVDFLVYPEEILYTSPIEFFNHAVIVLRRHAALPVVATFIRAVKSRWVADEYWPPKGELPTPLLELNITLSNGVVLSPAALLWFCDYLLHNSGRPDLKFSSFFAAIDAIVL